MRSTGRWRPNCCARSSVSKRTTNLCVAVLWGAGGHFCGGADLAAIGDPARRNELDPEGGGAGPMGPTRLALSKPLIAAVSGYAVAGGLELALLADLRVVERDAIFGVFCRRWGVPLIDGGTVRLPRLIGMGRALDLILTGRPVGGRRGARDGARQSHRRARARRSPPRRRWRTSSPPFRQQCMRADRQSAYRQWDLPLAEALRQEGARGVAIVASEGRRRRGAFRRGRGPAWRVPKLTRARRHDVPAHRPMLTRRHAASMPARLLRARSMAAVSTSALLRAGNAETLGEDEERHAGHAEPLRLGDFRAHFFFVGAVGEQLFDDLAIHAAFVRRLDQQRAIADVAALFEIELEQPVDDFVLRAGQERPADQPMRVERIGRARDFVEGEGDAFLGAERLEAFMRRLDAPVIAEFVDHIGAPLETLFGNARVELIGAPMDRDRLALLLGEGALQPLLAEIAPGADDVADDVDG